MTEAELAAIEARHKARNYSASRNHGHMSEMDAIEAHTDCAALLAEVERLREEVMDLRESARCLRTALEFYKARVFAPEPKP